MANLTVSTDTDAFLATANNAAARLALSGGVNSLGAFAIDVAKMTNFKSVSADQTFTFSGTPATGAWFGLIIQNTDADFAKTITIPNSLSVARNVGTTTVTLPPAAPAGFYNGFLFLKWFYDGTFYHLHGDWNNSILAVGQYTTLLGYRAAESAAGADFSVFVGQFAGANSPATGQAVAIGYNAGNNPGGYASTAIGYAAGQAGGGTSAVIIGHSSMKLADGTGVGNIVLGVHAGEDLATVSGAIILGYHAANGGAGNATNSVIIGDHAAAGVANSSNCIFLGPFAGVSRNNTLWIEGQGTSIGSHTPLIYGEFDNNLASVHGALLVSPAASSVETPAASAALEVKSTTKGLLLPRMTKTQRDAISSPVAGLAVYQTDNTPGLRVYNGTNWMRYTETAD